MQMVPPRQVYMLTPLSISECQELFLRGIVAQFGTREKKGYSHSAFHAHWRDGGPFCCGTDTHTYAQS